jgi:hypothetical protein
VGHPVVLTTHLLELLRRWKVEQPGNAYHLSAWIEYNGITQADAWMAVSQETRNNWPQAMLPCHPVITFYRQTLDLYTSLLS